MTLSLRQSNAVPVMHVSIVEFRNRSTPVSSFIGDRTATGRVTIEVLGMNDAVRVALRESLIAEGKFPTR